MSSILTRDSVVQDYKLKNDSIAVSLDVGFTGNDIIEGLPSLAVAVTAETTYTIDLSPLGDVDKVLSVESLEFAASGATAPTAHTFSFSDSTNLLTATATGGTPALVTVNNITDVLVIHYRLKS